MEHILIPLGEIHRPHNWEYADQTAREAATPDPVEVGLVALQLDDGSLWQLTGAGPTVWSRIGGGAGLVIAAGTQTAESGTVTFVNSNGITFGMSGSSQITASHNGITSQSVQTQNIIQQATLGGNTAGAMGAISSGTILLAGGNNITLSQNGNSVTISGPNTSAQSAQSLGLYGSSQTTGQSSSSTVDARSITFRGAGEVSVGLSAGEVVISAPVQSLQTQSRFNATLSGNTEGVLALVSSGVMTIAGGSNVTLSQNGNAITIRAADAANAGLAAIGAGTQTATSGTAVFANSNGISFGMSGSSQITASYTVPTQTAQSLGLYGSSQTTGQSSSSTVDARSLTVRGAGGISVGLSGGEFVISGPTTAAQTNQSLGVYGSSNTTGQSSSSTVDARSVTFRGIGLVSVGLSAGEVVISGTQTVQTQNVHNVTLSGNTAGVMAQVSSGTLVLAGGNNVTLSQNGNSVTISGANTVAQTNQSIGVYGSSQTTGQSSSSTVDARSLTVRGAGIVSVGLSAGEILISATTIQTVQTQNLHVASLSGNTSGVLALISSGTAIWHGGNNITLSQNGNSVTISGPNVGGAQTGISAIVAGTSTHTAGTVSFANSNGVSFGLDAGTLTASHNGLTTQTVQSVGIYGSSQTTGQSSSSTVDARSVTFRGAGIVSVGLSGGQVIISATEVAQTNQSIGIYGSSQTYGQSSSSTVDARSISIVGSGGVSVGMSAGSVLISGQTTAAQTNQTMGVYGSSNTTGQSSSSTVDARSLTFRGIGIVSVGLSAGEVVISASAAQTVQTQNVHNVTLSGNTAGVMAQISSGTLNLAGGNNITLSQNANSVTISGAAQTNQSIGIYGSSQTYGQSSSSTVDARSISIVGSGGVSVGMSAGSVLISGQTTAAQTAQTLGLYGSSQTTGQSSSSTVDARSLSVRGAGIVSVGLSGGELLISATTTQSVQTQNVHNVTLSGNTAGVMAQISSGTLNLAGGNNITLSQNGNSVTISGANTVAQTNQSIGIYGSSQTYGQSSSSTVDARSISIVGSGGVSVGMSGGSVLISGQTTVAQTNQSIGIYGSSQTTGQSSSSTVDARSLTFRGAGGVSVGLSGGEVIISGGAGGGNAFSAGMSTQGNTDGTTGYAQSRLLLVGTGPISLSQSLDGVSGTLSIGAPAVSNLTVAGIITLSSAGSTVTIGAPAFSAGLTNAGNTAGNTGTVSNQIVLLGGSNVTLSGSTAAGGMSVTVNAANQTNQSIGIYGSSQTYGQSSSSTVDARSISIVGSGGVSVGMSGGSVLISGQTTAAQTNQSIGIYGSSQTTGQSSSSTVDARSLTFRGMGGVTVGLSAGEVIISGATGGAGGGNSGGFYAFSNTTGDSSSSTLDLRSVSIRAYGLLSAGLSNGSLLLSTPDPVALTQLSVGLSDIGNTAGNTTVVTGRMVLAGGNNITLSGSTDAGSISITVSAANQSNQSIGIYGSSQTTGQSSSSTVDARSITFRGAGIVSVGMSAGQVLISATEVAQTNQSIGIYGSSQTYGQSSSSTVDARSISIVGSGGVSVGMSGGSVLISGQTTAAQTNQSIGIYGSSQTTGQSSSSTVDARSITFRGAGIVSVGMSAGQVLISATEVVQTNQSIGIYGSSQTYGQSSSSTVDARSISIVGSGGVSVGMSGGSVLISGQTTAAQTNQTVGLYASSQTTGQSSSSTVDARSISFIGRGIVTVGLSAGQFIVSATEVAQTNQSLGIYGSSQTTGQSSSSTVDARSLTFRGAGGVSVGLSGGEVIISGGAGGGNFSAGMSTHGNTAGGTGLVGSQLLLVGSNNITLSGSTNGGSATVSIIGGAGGAGYTAGMSTQGNTAGTTGLVTGQLLMVGSGPISLSQSVNGGSATLSFNAPATSSLVGTSGVSISTNGSTISVYLPATTKSGMNPYPDILHMADQVGNGTLQMEPMNLPNVQFDRILIPMNMTATSNSSGSMTVSVWMGWYTRNGSTLSLAQSASSSLGFTFSGTQGNYSLYSGMRHMVIATTMTLVEAQYWVGFVSRTTTGGAAGMTLSNIVASGLNTLFVGYMGSSHNTTQQWTLGQGVYTATTAGMPTAISFSQIRGSDSRAFRAPMFIMASSTV